jgi:cell division protein FtsW (lipid II flippase)
MTEVTALSPQQLFALIGLALAALVVILLALKVVARVGGAILRIGCVLLTLLLLTVGCYLAWLVLAARR